MTSNASTASVRWPLWLTGVWLLASIATIFAVPVLIATVPYWHEVRVYLQQLGQVHAWIAIAACVGLLVLSKRKHAETEEAWAQGALLIYVLGGVLSVLVLQFGIWPQWLARSNSTSLQLQVFALMAVHGVCAMLAWRRLRAYAREQAKNDAA